MAIGTIAAILGPTLLKGGINALGLGKGKKSGYEKELGSMARLLKSKYETPLDQSADFQSGKSILDARDNKNQEQVSKLFGAGNVTHEAKLAGMNSGNQAYASGVQGLMNHASRMRDNDLQRYMSMLGLQEQAGMNRRAEAQGSINNFLETVQNGSNSYLMSSLFGGSKMPKKKSKEVGITVDDLLGGGNVAPSYMQPRDDPFA